VVARWEGALDMNTAHAMLDRNADTSLDALQSIDEAQADRKPANDAMIAPRTH
jgi:aerobic C4-dicarboxylate transport protein